MKLHQLYSKPYPIDATCISRKHKPGKETVTESLTIYIKSQRPKQVKPFLLAHYKDEGNPPNPTPTITTTTPEENGPSKIPISSCLNNRPFPSSPRPLFQNEGRCSAFDIEIIFHSHANKTHFLKKGCAPSLILKVRVFETQK